MGFVSWSELLQLDLLICTVIALVLEVSSQHKRK